MVKVLGEAFLDKLFDPFFYLRHEDDVFQRVFGRCK